MSSAVITGVGLSTPLGLSTPACDAAFRAGLLAAGETRIRGGDGEPIRASFLRLLPAKSDRVERVLELAASALEDLIASTQIGTHRNLCAFLGLSDAGPELLARLTHSIADLLRSRMGTDTNSLFFTQGRSAFFFALQAALSALSSRACDATLVGCVDSLCSPDELRRLDAEHRLLGPAADGIIPGEGAAFVLLNRQVAGKKRPGESTSAVLCASTGRETNHFHQGLPSTAQGLSNALRTLRAHPEGRGKRADLLYTCETGERFWSQEFIVAYLRNTPIMPEPFAKTVAAASFGDLGAAAGGVMLGVGVQALARVQTRTGRIPYLLLCGSSDNGHVGACLVQGTPPDKQGSHVE